MATRQGTAVTTRGPRRISECRLLTRSRQYLLPCLKFRDSLLQSRTLPLGRSILTRNLFELLVRQAVDEFGRKKLQWRVGPGDKVVIRSLHAEVVHEALAGHFVVRLEDVMNLADHMVHVGHVVSLNDVVKADHDAVLAIVGRLVFEVCTYALLAAVRILAIFISLRSTRSTEGTRSTFSPNCR